MKPRRLLPIVMAGLACLGAAQVASAARTRKPPESDLASVDSRRGVVELALKLAKQETPAPMADNLPQPFNPTAFNQVAPSPPPTPGANPAPPDAAAAPHGDRDILAAIAPRILPSGTFMIGNKPQLILKGKRLKVGDHLTVAYEGQDYTLELTAIDRTNFSLRLNREEITRPIKPGKNP